MQGNKEKKLIVPSWNNSEIKYKNIRLTDNLKQFKLDLEEALNIIISKYKEYQPSLAEIIKKNNLMTSTNANSISFSFSKKDRKLFGRSQQQHWQLVEKLYTKLKKRGKNKIYLPQTGTHKDWVVSRIDYYTTPSIMRLLYLTEAFCASAVNFNAVACASLVKSMTEIPLCFGHIVWILDKQLDFETIRKEMKKLEFGNRDPETNLTIKGKITNKELHNHSDEIIRKLFKNNPSTINIFEALYKDANMIGHHNFEARMLCGFQDKDFWEVKDRKEQFVFFSNTIFQFFLYSYTIMSMSDVFMNAIDHHLKCLPDFVNRKKS